ncbi:MAG: dethiobiotin synthase [Deltaproteobacteria bacterium]|nr:dethiobiotin synthase [Deltaproteobacteria bacterium]
MDKGLSVRGLFVTGTGTEVGKSIVAGGLAALLREEGVDVGVMKPAESGCETVNGRVVAADGEFLRQMAGNDDDLDRVVSYRFTAPVAPGVAAEMENVTINPERIIANFNDLAERHEFLLVEGAGGVLVPLCGDFLVLDLMKLLRLPILVVGRGDLGTINHTLLTVRCVVAENLRPVGIILNNLSAAETVASRTNPGVIERLTDVPIWGVLPYRKGLCANQQCRDMIVGTIRENLELKYLNSLIDY